MFFSAPNVFMYNVYTYIYYSIMLISVHYHLANLHTRIVQHAHIVNLSGKCVRWMQKSRRRRRIYQAIHVDVFVEKFKRISRSTIRRTVAQVPTKKKRQILLLKCALRCVLYVRDTMRHCVCYKKNIWIN